MFYLSEWYMKKIPQENKEHKVPSKNVVSYKDDIFDVLEGIDKQKITNYVIKQVLKHKVPMLTFWSQGLIYKVPLPYHWWEKYFLVAKKKKEHTDEKYDLRDEFRVHQFVYESVDHPNVQVPELFGYQELPNGEQFIVMEFAPGQTLYTLLLNKMIEKYMPERGAAQNDREADTNIVKMFGVEKAKHMLSKIENTPYIYSQMKWMKLFTQDQAKQIKKNITEFLIEMHEKWVYHRDLGGSLRNILLSPDGKIYIIDFWKALKKHNIENIGETYIEETEHGITNFSADEEILDIIDAYTEK